MQQHFARPIPSSLGKLFRIQKLNLNCNNFERGISASSSRGPNLTHLGVGDNKLVRKFLEELTLLLKLTNFIIRDNNLSGTPPSIENLTSLKSLFAHDNAFGGSIPVTLDNLKNQHQLGFGGWELSGTIPPSFHNLSLLTIFSLCDNQLHGCFSPSFGFMFP